MTNRLQNNFRASRIPRWLHAIVKHLRPNMEKPKLIQKEIEVGIDDHLFIIIRRPDRPTISLDFFNDHGRAGLGVRTEGHGIANIMCDVEWMKPKSGNVMERFCPMCGEKINHASSMGHHCKEDA